VRSANGNVWTWATGGTEQGIHRRGVVTARYDEPRERMCVRHGPGGPSVMCVCEREREREEREKRRRVKESEG